MHFLRQLPKCINISYLIDVFMLISHPRIIYTSLHDWYLMHTVSLQMISKICTILAGDDEKDNDFAKDR